MVLVGFGRETADLDILSVIPGQAASRVVQLAGKGSALHEKYRVCIDHVGVANYPDNYESRLVRAFPVWPNVRLWALEPHDLALTKLEPYITGRTATWHRTTLKMWIEACWP